MLQGKARFIEGRLAELEDVMLADVIDPSTLKGKEIRFGQP